jgi:SAM-dependent methyltransferase
MKSIILSAAEVIAGYDAVARLYPDIPPMIIWRGWEYAVYRRYALPEPVFDVGCGDGRFFRCTWPSITDVTGVDISEGVADAALRSGVYRKVYAARAQDSPVAPGSFASAFANCSLEHMDDLPGELRAMARSLRPGGQFLCSVVTDKSIEWSALPLLLSAAGADGQARAVQSDYEHYHHLVNALSAESWIRQIEDAGIQVLHHIPILPRLTSHTFLLLDLMWHLPHPAGELGNLLQPFCASLPSFPAALVQALSGILAMESDWTVASGAVFWGRRP